VGWDARGPRAPGHAPPTAMSSQAPNAMKAPATMPDTKIFATGAFAFATPSCTAASYVFAGGSAPGTGGGWSCTAAGAAHAFNGAAAVNLRIRPTRKK
jgi:hypothetical protein